MDDSSVACTKCRGKGRRGMLGPSGLGLFSRDCTRCGGTRGSLLGPAAAGIEPEKAAAGAAGAPDMPKRSGSALSSMRGLNSFASCPDEDFDRALEENAGAVLTYTLGDMQNSLEVIERMELSAEAQAARKQVREGLRKLESCSIRGTAEPSADHGLSHGFDPMPRAPTGALGGDVSLAPGALAPMLNQLVMYLWPRIDTHVQNMIKNDIEPSINASLPGMLQGKVHFDRVSMGKSSPSFGPLVVHKIDDADETIEMNMGIKFESDLDIHINAVGVKIGLTKFTFKGDMVIKMSPRMNTPPFFGGMQVFFPNMPDISIAFEGAARMANMPGLRGAIRNSIDAAIGGICVLPRRIAIDMDEEDSIDITDLSFPEPDCVLRFTLFGGRDLIAADTNLFGAATSDPYVECSLGIKNWTSPVCTKTLSPVWGEDGKGLSVDFPVHNDHQILFLKLFDSDFGSADDLIGLGQRFDVAHLRDRHNETFDLKLTLPEEDNKDAGYLSINTRCLSLVETRPSGGPVGGDSGCSVAHVSMKLLSVTGLSHEGHPPYTMRMRILGTHEHAAHPTLHRGATAAMGGAGGKRGMLKKMATGNLGSSHVVEDVLAEASTQPSVPQPEAQLAEALQSICVSLASGKGSGKEHTSEEIADILQVNKRQVENFLAAKCSASAAKAQKEAQESRAATNPVFNEVLQSLLTDVPDLGIVEVCVMQKKNQVLATGVIHIRDILRAEGLRVDGPIRLSHGAEEGSVAELIGSVWLRWLE